jgi:hypothetical protein
MLEFFHADLIPTVYGGVRFKIEASVNYRNFCYEREFSFDELVNKGLVEHLFDGAKRSLMAEIEKYAPQKSLECVQTQPTTTVCQNASQEAMRS